MNSSFVGFHNEWYYISLFILLPTKFDHVFEEKTELPKADHAYYSVFYSFVIYLLIYLFLYDSFCQSISAGISVANLFHIHDG